VAEKFYLVPPEGYKIIFRASTTLPDGTRIYARQYGRKAFPILVPIDSHSR
jgi:hypothetical protein